MEGPFLPEGSGDAESPEEPLHLMGEDKNGRSDVYQQRMYAFERLFVYSMPKGKKKRRMFSDYTCKNCEEAYGEGGSSPKDHSVGR